MGPSLSIEVTEPLQEFFDDPAHPRPPSPPYQPPPFRRFIIHLPNGKEMVVRGHFMFPSHNYGAPATYEILDFTDGQQEVVAVFRADAVASVVVEPDDSPAADVAVVTEADGAAPGRAA